MDNEYNIRDRVAQHLYHFQLEDFELVRAVMASTGAVIVGASALAIINPHYTGPDELDFYVLRSGLNLLYAIVNNAGFMRVESDDVARYGLNPQQTYTLVHVETSNVIHIVVPVEDSVVRAVTNFKSTILMNYVAWHGAVVLYPDWTLELKTLVHRAEPGPLHMYHHGILVFTDALQVNGERGPHAFGTSPCTRPHRSIHDGLTLFWPFDRSLKGWDSLMELQADVDWQLASECVHCMEQWLYL